MNGLASQLSVIECIASVSATPPLADVLICPPATLIARAAQIAAGRIAIGAQDCSTEIAGAYTGDTSPEMLKDAGAWAVIVGHSERRQHHGETDAIAAAKAVAAWRAGLLAIICIGETQSQRQAGQALIAADYGGFTLKGEVAASLRGADYEIGDCGAHQLNPGDHYPDFIVRLARAVAAGQVTR